MADKMDRGLDEIIAESRPNGGNRDRRGGGPRRRPDRGDYPRDGVRKSTRDRDDSRHLDREWVHDRYDDHNARRVPAPRRRRDSPERAPSGGKLRVDNIHWDLTEEELEELFKRIGPVNSLKLRYDRAGRSEGIAFVTYEYPEDAKEAVRQFDGANANGQPIRLSLLPSGPGGGSGGRNPFDSAVMPSKSLAERISTPDGGSRSLSPRGRYTKEDAARRGIDRYVPGEDGGSRSPRPPRRRGGGGSGGEGRRPGARREPRGREGDSGARGGRSAPRGKKTQEELDAEMADYFGGGGGDGVEGASAENASASASAPAPAAAAATVDDVDMIE